MKVSEILILAADNHLASGRTCDSDTGSDPNSPYICDAVSATRWDSYGVIGSYEVGEALQFLDSLGMGSGFGVFSHVPKSRRQKARFDFLNLAALMADDLGLTTD